MSNEVAAALVVLEVFRTKGTESKITLTEDELHAAIMEAIDLAIDGGAHYAPEIQRARPRVPDRTRVGPRRGMGTADSDGSSSWTLHAGPA